MPKTEANSSTSYERKALNEATLSHCTLSPVDRFIGNSNTNPLPVSQFLCRRRSLFSTQYTSIAICLYLSSWNPWSPWFDDIFLPSLSTKTKHSFSLPGIPAQVFLYHNNLHYYTRHHHFIISTHSHTSCPLSLYICNCSFKDYW